MAILFVQIHPSQNISFKIISILLLDGSYARRQIFSICIPSEEILIAFHASLPTNQVKSKSPFRKLLLSAPEAPDMTVLTKNVIGVIGVICD